MQRGSGWRRESWLDIKIPELHSSSWMKDILCDPIIPDGDQAKIITVMWEIWTSRNNITHDRVSLDPVQTMKRTRDDLALLEVPLKQAQVLPGHGWRPHENGWIKINTDAGIAVDFMKGGAGGGVL